jgi:hypothetical protein
MVNIYDSMKIKVVVVEIDISNCVTKLEQSVLFNEKGKRETFKTKMGIYNTYIIGRYMDRKIVCSAILTLEPCAFQETKITMVFSFHWILNIALGMLPIYVIWLLLALILANNEHIIVSTGSLFVAVFWIITFTEEMKDKTTERLFKILEITDPLT